MVQLTERDFISVCNPTVTEHMKGDFPQGL